MPVSFAVTQTCLKTKARLGTLKTAHSTQVTPIFMPVGTHAAVRSQRIADIQQLGFQLLLANTYHLILRPGADFFTQKNIDLRTFASWPHGFLTDSGGFQIFSLSNTRKITEQGALFRNHINGNETLLTPEKSIAAQIAWGSDIMMVLDECVPSTTTHDDAARAMHLTHRWAKRSYDAKIQAESTQGIFGIVQGACFESLRIESAQALSEMNFCGLAVGGLAVGESRAEREAMTSLVTDYLPKDKPRYLMGVGTPLDILEAVSRGIDMFDCVLPTMLGQQGVAFNWDGKIDLRKSAFFDDTNPIEKECDCYCCSNYSRQYLHHLIKTYDVSSASLIGLHNLAFYARLMALIREHLAAGTFYEFYQQTAKRFAAIDTTDELLSGSSLKNSANLDTRKPTSANEPISSAEYDIVERKNRENKYVVSIRHIASGEVMHSSEDPYRESKLLYVTQAKLEERFKNTPSVTIWDVGLGAGTNAMGAVDCWEQSNRSAALTIESFEITLEPLQLVLKQKAKFPHAQHPYLSTIASDKKVADQNFAWNLFVGDFMDHLNRAKKPDIIYFDPFSYKVDSPLWSLDAFQKLFAVIKDTTAVAFTFSAATRARAAMLAAGFYVAYGSATGRKKETTIFMTPAAAKQENYQLLDQRWLTRWERSHSQFPHDIESIASEPDRSEQKAHFAEIIRRHPQFNLLSQPTASSEVSQ